MSLLIAVRIELLDVKDMAGIALRNFKNLPTSSAARC